MPGPPGGGMGVGTPGGVGMVKLCCSLVRYIYSIR